MNQVLVDPGTAMVIDGFDELTDDYDDRPIPSQQEMAHTLGDGAI